MNPHPSKPREIIVFIVFAGFYITFMAMIAYGVWEMSR